MIYAFINYPVPHITIHQDPNCAFVHLHPEQDSSRREMQITMENLSNSLLLFRKREVDFRSKAGWNSLWLKLDLGDFDSEMDVVTRIMKYLGERYLPLANLTPKIHC